MHLAKAQWGSKLVKSRAWDDAVRTIMLASKSLPNLPDGDRLPIHEVKGCESNVWMHLSVENETIDFRAYSDGKIVRGLIQIISEPIQNLSIEKFTEFDFDGYLTQLGLNKYLSPSRTSGVAAIVEKLKSLQTSL